MKYSEITKYVLKTQSQRVHLYGNGTSTWYKYKQDGSISPKPTQVRTYKGGLIYFNIQFATDVDFVKEIEEHSPIKVIIENN